MSSKTKRIGDRLDVKPEMEVKTKSLTFRVDLTVCEESPSDCTDMSAYIVVTGVPENLPSEYIDTVARSAEMQFATALNERRFLELYNIGKTARDEQPMFINLNKISYIKVKSVTEFKAE